MKHERFEIARDNRSEEDYYTENGIQHLNTYLGDELSKAFAEYQKKYPGMPYHLAKPLSNFGRS